jgi:hypothetical protein
MVFHRIACPPTCRDTSAWIAWCAVWCFFQLVAEAFLVTGVIAIGELCDTEQTAIAITLTCATFLHAWLPIFSRAQCGRCEWVEWLTVDLDWLTDNRTDLQEELNATARGEAFSSCSICGDCGDCGCPECDCPRCQCPTGDTLEGLCIAVVTIFPVVFGISQLCVGSYVVGALCTGLPILACSVVLCAAKCKGEI